MKRNHIHFASRLPQPQKNKQDKQNTSTTPISGMRLSSQIYIYINGSKCANDDIKFYRSDNGVILTAGVKEEGMLPLQYFDKVVDAATGNIIN